MSSAHPASPPFDPRHARGLEGEQAAIAYLRAQGWVLESHRFRFGRHDLDLVMRSGDLVAFIEVKTRSSTRFGAAAESVGWRKRRILDQGAAWWRRQHGRPGDRYRFDVVEVYQQGAGGAPRVEHIPDAWRG
jgi:putative endonuclease